MIKIKKKYFVERKRKILSKRYNIITNIFSGKYLYLAFILFFCYFYILPLYGRDLWKYYFPYTKDESHETSIHFFLKFK